MKVEHFEKADLSTFLHEGPHIYLELYRDLMARADAPEELKGDWATILSFLGVQDGSEIRMEHHEKWACAWEAYLMQGKAPTRELRGAFARFRAWLVSIYRSIRSLGVELTDEVRGVFDRMAAVEDGMDAMEEDLGLSPLVETSRRSASRRRRRGGTRSGSRPGAKRAGRRSAARRWRA